MICSNWGDILECKFKRFDQLTNDELYGILQLRVEVFVVEQNCPYQDLDGKDRQAMHLFVEDNGVIVGVLRILPEGVGFDDMAIGRLIVRKSYRGKGLSRMLMKKAMKYIICDLDKDRIRLSGQAYLTNFYTGLGFKKVSDCYLEDGIEHFEFLYES